jgi:hypothetical protein
MLINDHHSIANHVASLILDHWMSLLRAVSSALSDEVSFIDKMSRSFHMHLFVLCLSCLLVHQTVTKVTALISVNPLE